MGKLHLACGPVYLKGYINIDIKGELVKDRPDLVKKNITALSEYFKSPYVKQPLGHNKRKEIVVDLKADVTNLPYPNDSVDEILSVNLIDHLKYKDFQKALREWKRILKKNSLLIIDVGDVVRSVKMLLRAKNKEDIEWALRLIYCHSRDRYDSHYWGYSPDYLWGILKEFGFKKVWIKRNYIKHIYPNFQICVKK